MTIWIWKRLKAPLTRKLLCGVVVVTVLAAIALHIEAALFAYRTRNLLLTLRKVDAGQTTKGELLLLLPTLRRIDSVDTKCGPAGETFHFERINLPSSRVGQRIFGAIYENSTLYKAVYWVGYRPRRMYVDANVEHGVVTRWAFRLDIAPTENHYPGAVTVGVSSPISVLRYSESPIADEQNPYFSARRYFKWRVWDLEVSYSRMAAP